MIFFVIHVKYRLRDGDQFYHSTSNLFQLKLLGRLGRLSPSYFLNRTGKNTKDNCQNNSDSPSNKLHQP